MSLLILLVMISWWCPSAGIETRILRLLTILSLRLVRRKCRRSLLTFLIFRIMLTSRLLLFLILSLSNPRILKTGRACALSGDLLLTRSYLILRFVL